MVQLEIYFDKTAYTRFGSDAYQFFKGKLVERESPDDHSETLETSSEDLDENLHPENEHKSEAVEEQEIQSYRKELDGFYPFPTSYKQILDSINDKGEPVQSYNLKLSHYLIHKYLLGIFGQLELTDEDVEDARYLELSLIHI